MGTDGLGRRHKRTRWRNNVAFSQHRWCTQVVGLLTLATCLSGCGSSSNPLAPVGGIYLRVDDLVTGTGPLVEIGDVLTVNQVGWLYDSSKPDNKGQQIDAANGVTFVLGAGQVISGLEQGITGMRVGGKRRIQIPPDLAFGPTGSGAVPPDTPVVFEIEIVDKQQLVTGSAPFSITDITVGTGPEARVGSRLTVDYAGWLYNDDQPDNRGIRFDESAAGGFTFILGTGAVIPGWEQGLVGMREGGERRLVIPPELAYGAARRGLIPPNATLVFYITLISVQ